VPACWICGGTTLGPIHETRFDFSEYRDQDPELARYTGATVALARCRACGFAQPAAVPALPRYFERMYDQRWSDEWIAREFASTTKDLIFRDVLAGLARRLPRGRRRLLDVGAHAGRFIRLAEDLGWDADGIELNPRTAAFAAARVRGRIYRADAAALPPDFGPFDAVTLTDVLEHIPDPLGLLRALRERLAPGGWIAVKVPNGPGQARKERVRGWLQPGRRPRIADNLVHVSHFSPASLRLALGRAGYAEVDVTVGAPERLERGRAGNLVRLLGFRAGRLLPFGVRTPLALNLQAYATRPS
jgi:SAM-dependent methyltransferase